MPHPGLHSGRGEGIAHLGQPLLLPPGLAALRVCPLAGIVKLVGMLLGFNMDWIGFQFGSYSAGPFATLLASILLGAILFFAGWLCWKLTVYLVKLMGRGKRLAEGRG